MEESMPRYEQMRLKYHVYLLGLPGADKLFR